MLDREQIKEIICQAIDQVNELLLDKDLLSKDDSTVIVGKDAKLDSMGYINFIVALEDELAKQVGYDLMLVDELSPVDADAPQWSTVAELIDLIFLMTQTKQ